MLIYFMKEEIVFILNCINYTIYMLSKHDNTISRRELMNYFDLDNYAEQYNDLIILHGKISTAANKKFYNLKLV